MRYRHVILSGMLARWASACGPGQADDDIGSDSNTGTGDSNDDGPDDGTTDDGSEHGLASDVFDSDEVYLAGTLRDSYPIGAPCIDWLFAHWSAPHVAASGFECDFAPWSAGIRPSDGRLIYAYHASIREFHCDTCPLFHAVDYPKSGTLENDTLLTDTVCFPLEILIGPSDDYLYRCHETWYDASGEIVYEEQEGPLLHLGYDGFALTDSSVIELGSIAAIPIDNPAPGPAAGHTQRVDPDGGFFVVRGSKDLPQLWHVSHDGSSTELGSYPPAPPGCNLGYQMALDGSGALIQDGGCASNTVLLRRDLQGNSEVVYTGFDEPLANLYSPALVTGP